jgi:hypothetical protein
MRLCHATSKSLWLSLADATTVTRRCWKKRTGCVVTVDLPENAVIYKDDGLNSDDDCTAVLFIGTVAAETIWRLSNETNY